MMRVTQFALVLLPLLATRACKDPNQQSDSGGCVPDYPVSNASDVVLSPPSPCLVPGSLCVSAAQACPDGSHATELTYCGAGTCCLPNRPVGDESGAGSDSAAEAPDAESDGPDDGTVIIDP